MERHIRAIAEGNTPNLEDRISNLNLVTYERRHFMDKLYTVRDAYRYEMNELKQITKSKSRQMVIKVFEDLKKLYFNEYSVLVEQFNQMRY